MNILVQVLVICQDARNVIVPTVGPGARPMRWTACTTGMDEWTWLEQNVMGAFDRRVHDYEKIIVIYRWPVPGPWMNTYVTTSDISNQEKAAVMRTHVNLGHPQTREFVRLLKAAGTRDDIINYVLREFECPGCQVEKRPPTRLPAATPRTYDFNVVVGVDILFVHGENNRAEYPVLNITCWGTLYSTFGLVDLHRRTAELAWMAFTRLWLRTLGAPQFIIFDQGNEFVGTRFQQGLEQHGICPVEISRDAPFENGVTERRGGLFKDLYYKTRELVQPQNPVEVETMIFEVSWALQTLVNRSGFSPAQRVLGRQPQVALEALSDHGLYHLSSSQDRAWAEAERIRRAAREALVQLDAKERLSRARRSRPRRELEKRQFVEGEPVMLWRQGRRGALAKVGPCFVVLQRDHTVWVTRRGELYKCHVSQVFPMGSLERQGLEAIPLDLLQAKEQLRYNSEKLTYTDVSQENQDDDGEQRRSKGPPDGPIHESPSEPHALPIRESCQNLMHYQSVKVRQNLMHYQSVKVRQNLMHYQSVKVRQNLMHYLVPWKSQMMIKKQVVSRLGRLGQRDRHPVLPVLVKAARAVVGHQHCQFRQARSPGWRSGHQVGMVPGFVVGHVSMQMHVASEPLRLWDHCGAM